MSARVIDSILFNYLKSQIEQSNPDAAKRALQQICKLFRSGFKIANSNDHHKIENATLGALHMHRQKEKVRRWALNALAQYGRAKYSRTLVLQTLADFNNDPQTAASAIAALFFMTKDAHAVLKKHDTIHQDIIVLSALQRAKLSEIDISSTSIKIDHASPDILKLALLIVGLNRAPENIFDPKHPNSTIVKQLGAHDNAIVSQYSIWAITENPNLGANDLGIDLQSIEKMPVNVRGWVYRLLAMEKTEAIKHMEYIQLGCSDPETEARMGLAQGLKDTYFDGLEPLALDWFYSESEDEIRMSLLDHMVCNAKFCSAYGETAKEIYSKEPDNSSLRQRLEANAAGMALYGEFRRIGYNGSDDLFARPNRGQGDLYVTNNINITGSVQAGAVSFGGDASNSGEIKIYFNPQTVQLLQDNLDQVKGDIANLNIDHELKTKIEKAIVDAKNSPTKDKIGVVIGGLKAVNEASGNVAGIVTTIAALAKLAGFG